MIDKIKSVAVIGAGTMGSGIAALAADKNCTVLLLDISNQAAEAGLSKITNQKRPVLENPESIRNITIGNFKDDFHKISSFDWICEAVIEKLEVKKDIFEKINQFRNKDSLISSNTSGIPLKDITENLDEHFLTQVCITHFFNPVKIMKLCELIPGKLTSKNTINVLKNFLTIEMEKGVVNAKDTVNFIGNRIGCFFMLKGLHEAKIARKEGLSVEEIDSLLSKPVGLPPTGLYGLIDLIGLDVMYAVGKNLENNLPKEDEGLKYVSLPDEELHMYKKGQLGRKSGGGFYRVNVLSDGHKTKQAYDPSTKQWHDAIMINTYSDFESKLYFDNTKQGNLVWNIMASTLLYAADLIPEIADDIVNIDRAMKWGFAWQLGPFEMLDKIGIQNTIIACREKGVRIPRMLKLCEENGFNNFYKNGSYLSSEGVYKSIDAL